jgi:hypothetical protein
MLLDSIVRRFPALKTLSEATQSLRLMGNLSLAMAQVESESAEMTRSGRRFSGIGGTSGAASVATVPSTAAAWALYNADISRSYIIDSISFWEIAAVSAPVGGSIIGIVSPITSTIPPAATGSTVASDSAGGLSSKAVFATAYTLPALSGNVQWFVIGSFSGGAPGIGGGFSADVKGRIIVPPGKVLGLSVLAATGASPTYIPGVTWYESELDLE